MGLLTMLVITSLANASDDDADTEGLIGRSRGRAVADPGVMSDITIQTCELTRFGDVRVVGEIANLSPENAGYLFSIDVLDRMGKRIGVVEGTESARAGQTIVFLALGTDEVATRSFACELSYAERAVLPMSSTAPQSDITIRSCGFDSSADSVETRVEITNRSSSRSAYLVEIDVIDESGRRIAQVSAGSEQVDVPPGGTTILHGVGFPPPVGITGAIRCEVASARQLPV